MPLIRFIPMLFLTLQRLLQNTAKIEEKHCTEFVKTPGINPHFPIPVIHNLALIFLFFFWHTEFRALLGHNKEELKKLRQFFF